MYQPPTNPPGFGDGFQQAMQGMQQDDQHHVLGDAAIAAGAAMVGYEAYTRRREVMSLMTPPEQAVYNSQTGWRALRRIVWALATVILTLGPWFTGFWTFFIPTASVAVAIWVRLRWRRRFLRSRRALAVLKDEGLIFSVPRRGYYVSPR